MIQYPCWRWSADCPEGRIFATAEDLAAAPGVWVDSPALLVPPEPSTPEDVAPARKRARKTDAAAETAAIIAQLEEIAQ